MVTRVCVHSSILPWKTFYVKESFLLSRVNNLFTDENPELRVSTSPYVTILSTDLD